MIAIYGVRSGTKSILRFRGLGNTSSLRKLFFESLSVVFVASVPCLRIVTSLVSSYCFLRGTAGFSSWRRYGLVSSLPVVASFLCLRVVGSSFRRLRYILDNGKSTFQKQDGNQGERVEKRDVRV